MTPAYGETFAWISYEITQFHQKEFFSPNFFFFFSEDWTQERIYNHLTAYFKWYLIFKFYSPQNLDSDSTSWSISPASVRADYYKI